LEKQTVRENGKLDCRLFAVLCDLGNSCFNRATDIFLVQVSYVSEGERVLQNTVAQHSVHLTGGYAPRFQAGILAQARSVKRALSCPSRQQVTQTVGWQFYKTKKVSNGL